MKLALLSQRSYLYTTKRLVAAAEHRGHSIRVIDPLGCYMSIAAGRPEIHYRGEALTDYDAVMQRTKLHCRSLPNRLFTSTGVHTGGLAKSGEAGCAAPRYNAEVCSAETSRKPCGDRYIRAHKWISRVRD